MTCSTASAFIRHDCTAGKTTRDVEKVRQQYVEKELGLVNEHRPRGARNLDGAMPTVSEQHQPNYNADFTQQHQPNYNTDFKGLHQPNYTTNFMEQQLSIFEQFGCLI